MNFFSLFLGIPFFFRSEWTGRLGRGFVGDFQDNLFFFIWFSHIYHRSRIKYDDSLENKSFIEKKQEK